MIFKLLFCVVKLTRWEKNYTFNTVRALLSVLICEHSYCLDKLLLTHHLVNILQHLAIFFTVTKKTLEVLNFGVEHLVLT